jgi:hypothetical protein
MANGYILNRSLTLHHTWQLDLTQARHWLQSLVERHSPQPCSARPLGLHLPERVWRRHSALLMCLQERAYDER